MDPSISVVTVTLNAERVLPHLFASLRAQSDRSFDYVVIDGASQDRTWNLVEEAGDIVTCAVSEPDCGLYDALNKAIRRVRSDYYVVAGADDTLDPDAIRNYKRAARETGADVIVAGVKVSDSVRSGYRPNRAWLGHSAMITSHSVGMLIRSSLHGRFGEYPMRYPLLADGYIIKKLCTNADVKTVEAGFVAGEFSVDGISHRSLIRALCESWQIQIDTGEQPLVQFLLFQIRLLKNLFKIVRR
jgi:glycosyltransferase involved in cell wall biosynthesis